MPTRAAESRARSKNDVGPFGVRELAPVFEAVSQSVSKLLHSIVDGYDNGKLFLSVRSR